MLGVAEYASHDEIHRAYRRLVKRWHPDRWAIASRSEQLRAEREMRKLTAAYATLGDAARRFAYDEQRHAFANPDAQVHAHAHTHTHAHQAAHQTYQTGAFSTGVETAGNPNGAGQLAGVLALILGIALCSGASRSDGLTNLPILVLFGGLALALLAAAFFLTSSPLAKGATAWMEGEPRGYTVHYPQHQAHETAHAGSAQHHTEGHGAGAEDEGDAAARFERLVDEALAGLPDEFRPYMANVVVRVEEQPSAETLREANVPPGATLLGLYHGVPLTKQGIAGGGPEVISIYRRPIERYCHADADAIREQVRATVLHEIAHHFGIDHDDMPEWVK